MSEPLLPARLWDACVTDEPQPLMGVIVDDRRTPLPQAFIESTTEYDYAELPERLRAGLERWCEEFRKWDRTEGYGAERIREQFARRP